ncbi:IS1595 family transposase [Colwellia sp. C1TZA3]|nr:IS1595 family transposase [Colwellia sp. C1TZA3]
MARNRQQQKFDKKLERSTGASFYQLLNKHVEKDAIICSDGFRSYGVLARKLNMAHKPINLTKKSRVREKVFHIQNVNAYHGWIARFHGVATKYLDNYLNWYRFIESSDNPN